MHFADLAEINDLVRVLEGRVGLLAMLREALDSPRPYLRIGSDHTVPYMRGLAMVAANYGLATRNLGTVSLIGPRRMDYAAAIRSVRGAAHALRCGGVTRSDAEGSYRGARPRAVEAAGETADWRAVAARCRSGTADASPRSGARSVGRAALK